MIWKNTSKQFGIIAKSFHWITALIIISILALGLYMRDMDTSPLKFKLFFWHKSIGITILALIALRLIWRFINIKPAPLANHKAWEKKLTKIIHTLLYVCLFTMPLTGWMMSSAKGFSVSVFGWFTLPDLIEENKELGHLLHNAHNYAGDILIICIILHFGGAIKHHIIDKDSTLRRILPFSKIAITIALLGIFTGTAAHANSPPTIPQWTIDHTQSHLTFEGTQMKAPFTGEFTKFDGFIFFDPNDPSASIANITIDMTSVITKNEERDSNILGSPWFFTSSFPEAKFETTSFEKTDENAYVAHANLTIRDVSLSVSLPFTLTISKDADNRKTANMQGTLILQRLDYNIGTGEWKDTSFVGNPVTIKVLLVAHTDGYISMPE